MDSDSYIGLNIIKHFSKFEWESRNFCQFLDRNLPYFKIQFECCLKCVGCNSCLMLSDKDQFNHHPKGYILCHRYNQPQDTVTEGL